MKQILVATDFSNGAANAMKYAWSWPKYCIWSLRHTCHTPNRRHQQQYLQRHFIEDYYNNKRQALAEWVGKYADDERFKNVKVTTLCDVGFLRAVITRYVKSIL